MSATNKEAILGLEELKDWERLPYCIEEPMQTEGVAVITQEIIDMAIKALDQVSHLNNRPCEACEYHKETGCVKWECVFEK